MREWCGMACGRDWRGEPSIFAKWQNEEMKDACMKSTRSVGAWVNGGRSGRCGEKRQGDRSADLGSEGHVAGLGLTGDGAKQEKMVRKECWRGKARARCVGMLAQGRKEHVVREKDGMERFI
ncbi:hypothetical protein TRVL_06324 [Trypanosoma vivax]|nr:hypothetical protein TRVL_06324 [Trypanosoma vivax]